MRNIYDTLMGTQEIKSHDEDWLLYKKGQTRMLNYQILGLLITTILAYFLPDYRIIVTLPTILLALFLVRLGEYKGYNECLFDLENE